MNKYKHVLIVDDDDINIFALKAVLLSREFKVSSVQDGLAAVGLLESPDHAIEVVLMDMMMPLMDGFEAIQKIRQLPHGNQFKIIALTAKVMRGDRQKCLDAGADEYCAKPVEIDQLMSIFERI